MTDSHDTSTGKKTAGAFDIRIIIAMLIGVPCGIVAAVWRNGAADQALSGFAMLGASIPSFWFGLILMQVFAVGLGWFPVAGYGDPGVPLSDRLHHLVLPAIVLTTVFSVIGTLQLLAEPQVFRSFSAAVSSTYTPNLTVYSTSSVPNFNLAAAFSVVLAVATFILSFSILKVTQRRGGVQ